MYFSKTCYSKNFFSSLARGGHSLWDISLHSIEFYLPHALKSQKQTSHSFIQLNRQIIACTAEVNVLFLSNSNTLRDHIVQSFHFTNEVSDAQINCDFPKILLQYQRLSQSYNPGLFLLSIFSPSILCCINYWVKLNQSIFSQAPSQEHFIGSFNASIYLLLNWVIHSFNWGCQILDLMIL